VGILPGMARYANNGKGVGARHVPNEYNALTPSVVFQDM
jgi:hypothetical protein